MSNRLSGTVKVIKEESVDIEDKEKKAEGEKEEDKEDDESKGEGEGDAEGEDKEEEEEEEEEYHAIYDPAKYLELYKNALTSRPGRKRHTAIWKTDPA